MTAFAVFADVQAVWPRPLSEFEITMVTTQLEYAALLIRQKVPSIDAWIAAGTLDPDIAKYVSVQMVRGFLLNPEGRKSGTRSIDDYTEGWSLSDAVAAGGMDVTDAFLLLLRPNSIAPTGAFTIRFIPPPRLRC
jgi:hypothetical protein